MTDTFHEQIRISLENPNLQSALDGNAERRIEAQQSAFASLPEDLARMRRRAHEVRRDTIANLDEYLEQFITKAHGNGLIIHRAQSGAEAVQIVLAIAREKSAKLVVKSKSMVSEEIHLNRALEQVGIKVVETDLGEFIIQLRGEPPSHIITPAVHLRRNDVGRTFQEKLRIPYTEDIPTLTALARSELRQAFLAADIGISGVNFGVAESGTLCLVTNEGNGRMVTTLPPVHIALMGIERLVPRFEDLGLMLYLLPRSATGQKLSVYTSFIRSPKQEGEIDGPLVRHLILIDNGRSNLRQSVLCESLYCIRCGACLNVCPVFREIGGHAYVGVDGTTVTYPGPIGSVISPGLFGGEQYGWLARASSLCGACKEACPVDIDLPKLLLRVRAGLVPGAPSSGVREHGMHETKPIPSQAPRSLKAGLKLYRWLATSPRRFGAAQWFAGAFSRLFSPFSRWMRLPALSGWGMSRDFPRPALETFRRQFSSLEPVSLDGVAAAPPSTAYEGHDEYARYALGREALEGDRSKVSVVERFEAEFTALGGDFTRCREMEIAQKIIKLLREERVSEIQAWDELEFPPDLLKVLQAEGIRISTLADPRIKAGITASLAGIAETGSLVIPAGPSRPQTASLLPDIHIALLNKNDIFESLSQALQSPELRQASAATLISGPSRTADIEMTLTIGVHGPRRVHVICFE